MSYWVAVVAWSDGSEREIDVVGVFGSPDAAFSAVQARLIDETGFVIGLEDSGQRQGTMRDSNVTWDWVIQQVN